MRNWTLALLLWIPAVSGWAATVNNSYERNTLVQTSATQNTPTMQAQAWGLNLSEWQHYQQLMQGPAGKWYAHLSPAAVLGMNASNTMEQQHFAEIVAKEEHDKLAQEIRFNNAVHRALLRLYPQEMPIQPFDMSAFNPHSFHLHATPLSTKALTLQPGDHLVLFVDPTRGPDFLALPALLAALKTRPGITLDIFCVGNVSDSLIRQWALMNNLPTNLVTTGKITLNRDQGKLAQLAGPVNLPYVLLVRHQQSMPLSVGNLP